MTQPKDILKHYWGYESFRPPQEEIIRSVLEGKDSKSLKSFLNTESLGNLNLSFQDASRLQSEEIVKAVKRIEFNDRSALMLVALKSEEDELSAQNTHQHTFFIVIQSFLSDPTHVI